MKKYFIIILSALFLLLMPNYAFAAEDSIFTKEYADMVSSYRTENVNTQDDEVLLFSTKTYSGKYGNQLTGNAKKIYKELVKYYYTNQKTGTLKLSSTVSVTFKAKLKNGKIDESTKDYKKAADKLSQDFLYATEAFAEDYPEVFWLNYLDLSCVVDVYKNKSYSTGYRGVLKVKTIYPSKDKNYPGEFFPGASKKIKDYNSGVKKAVASIKKDINNSRNRLAIYLGIHDYICKKVSYNTKAANASENSTKYLYASTSANLFLSKPYKNDRKLLCDGYAESFKVLCDAFGLDDSCVTVVGKTPEGLHEWNYVKINTSWYLVDTTWDDQEKLGTQYVYFLAGQNSIGYDNVSIKKERTAYPYFSYKTCKFTLPKLATKDFNVNEKISPVLKFESSSVTKKYKKKLTFTNKLIKKETDGKITYSSSNKKIATVNAKTGKVTILKKGKVTITATSKAGKSYKKGSKKYTLMVK